VEDGEAVTPGRRRFEDSVRQTYIDLYEGKMRRSEATRLS
jgi:hypothetical protein